MSAPLLEINGLGVQLRDRAILRELSFAVRAGECVGLVGESGSGKTTLALALMGLLPSGMHATGEARFEGTDLIQLDAESHRTLRGRRMSMVFQEPLSALNPRLRVGDQVAETARIHGEASEQRALGAAIEALRRVGLASPEERALRFPHELSGGERQRVLLAMALVLGPALLIADEPTTALDVTVQAQFLALLAEQRHARGLGVLLVTHDLAVVAEACDRVVVLQDGQLVESGTVRDVFANPTHPHTIELLRDSRTTGGATA